MQQQTKKQNHIFCICLQINTKKRLVDRVCENAVFLPQLVKAQQIEIKPNPEAKESKKEQVEAMFDSIAPKYDFLNRVLSAGIDVYWRKVTIKAVSSFQPENLLDIATGTADLAIAATKLPVRHITGVDISEKMLGIGQIKINHKRLEKRITLIKADSERLPFQDNKFDAITVSFGVRNFGNLQAGLNEMYRVLKNGGVVAVLEFSKPTLPLIKQLYQFYFRFVLPFWGNLISKNKHAYTYLPKSVQHFPEGEDFAGYLRQSGFSQIRIHPLTLGICTLYIAVK
jgi:demethylmenaquinone methyltransferase/2-methoxy-6-polyprenyl-1,4-benzoquinol methylase